MNDNKGNNILLKIQLVQIVIGDICSNPNYAMIYL